jgi:NAD+ synthetase
MKIAALQINPTVNDFDGNVALIEAAWRKAASAGAELCLAPELAVCGYPVLDLALQSSFVARNETARDRLVALSKEIGAGLLFGLVLANESESGKPLSNAAILCDRGRVLAVKRKALLPTYDVFDERRYFEPDATPVVADFRGAKLGLLICEDIWVERGLLGRLDYTLDPPADCVAQGAQILLNISASPWGEGKHFFREKLCQSVAQRVKRPLFMCNQWGGNDDLLFDGACIGVDASGKTVARGKFFAEDIVFFDAAHTWRADSVADQIDALCVGISDYFRKTGFKKALLGLSGGIDSALVACLAARALGPKNITGITMPTRFSSKGSIEDSRTLAKALGIKFEEISIDGAFENLRTLCGKPGGLAEENLQARIRGMLLMTRSNAEGALVLTTGNQSELAVGYSTLYGDMCGALEVIGDLPKMRVYEMARRFVEIPPDTHTKAPSAELRENQTDQDSLPPYSELDAILAEYLDKRLDADAIIKAGHDEATVKRVARMVEIAEYKRRQAPIVLRVSAHAFGPGRRMPVAKK